MKRWLHAVPLLLIASPAWADEVLSAEGVRTVEIHVASGDVKVERHDKDEIVVSRGDRIQIERSDRRLRIKSTNGDVSIRVPKVLIDVNAQSGDVRIRGAYPRIIAHTASGRVSIDGQADEMEVRSLSGDVRLRGRSKEVRVDCVSGDVDSDLDVSDLLSLRVTSGDVRIRADKLAERTEVESVDGDTVVQGGLVPDGVLRARTMSGEVRFKRTNEVGFRLEARARYGSVRVKGKKRASGDSHSEVVGDGSADVRLTAFSGTIDVD